MWWERQTWNPNNKKNMETNVKNVNNPLIVRCEYCGGDLSYDIVGQRYCCAHCGAQASNAEKKAEHLKWKSIRKKAVMEELAHVKSFSCPACGAQTIVTGEDAAAQCPFCQNTMIDATFGGNDVPEVILPFKLSKEQAEAKLKEWLDKNSNNLAAKVIRRSIGNITGCYLPYHIVRGAYNCKLKIRTTDTSEWGYPFNAYLKHTAVNASNDLSNLFLDGIEPFDFDSALEFNFGYLNHQNAKVQNIGGQELNNRIEEETRAELYRNISKKVHTKELSITLTGDNNESIAALMPVYLLKCKSGISAAVNGQTGKVSIDTGKKKNATGLWWMAPTIATLSVVVGAWILAGYALGLLGGLVFGMVFFAVAWTRHSKEMIPDILTYPEKQEERDDTQTEFIADFGEGLVPAKLRFFTFWRIVKTVVGVLVAIFLPAILAVPIQLMRGLPLTDIHLEYGAAWYCIPGFFAILAAGGIAKTMMYNAPIYYEILPNGKSKRRRVKNSGREWQKTILKSLETKEEKRVGCLIIGLLVFMLTGSLLAML